MNKDLKETWIKSGVVEFKENEHGLEQAILKHSSGSSVTTYLFGAHIVSWQAAALGEMLYLSPQSDLTGQKPIRGGIPLVFPQFGLGDLPAHGFARTAPWHITACHRDNSGSSVLTFTLKSTPEILKLWPHTFQASLSIELSDTLTTIFAVQNLGKESFIYQNAFHTYFAVQDIRHTQVVGLEGLQYLDSTKQRAQFSETANAINFNSETDRIYLAAPDALEIIDRAGKRMIAIEKTGAKDAVVWNPWIERAKAIADLPDTGYQNFVCVEAGNVAQPIALAPGQTFLSSTILRAKAL